MIVFAPLPGCLINTIVLKLLKLYNMLKFRQVPVAESTISWYFKYLKDKKKAYFKKIFLYKNVT